MDEHQSIHSFIHWLVGWLIGRGWANICEGFVPGFSWQTWLRTILVLIGTQVAWPIGPSAIFTQFSDWVWVKIKDLGDHRFKFIFSINHPITGVLNFDSYPHNKFNPNVRSSLFPKIGFDLLLYRLFRFNYAAGALDNCCGCKSWPDGCVNMWCFFQHGRQVTVQPCSKWPPCAKPFLVTSSEAAGNRCQDLAVHLLSLLDRSISSWSIISSMFIFHSFWDHDPIWFFLRALKQ